MPATEYNYILKPHTFGTMLRSPRRVPIKLLSVVVAALIVVSSVAVYMGFSMHDSPPVTANGGVINISKYVNMALNVTVRNAQGQVVANRYLPHDLLLNNFYYMMLYPFLTSTSYPSSWDLVNTAGTSETFCYSSCATYPYTSTPPPPIISIGSGTTAPAVTNYNLTTFVAQMPAISVPQTYYSATSANVTFSSTEAFASATMISEAGLILEEYPNIYFMVAHDTFTTVNVPANGAITIAYTLGISDPNGIFSLNFVNFLLSLFGAYNTCFASSCFQQYGEFKYYEASGTANQAYVYQMTLKTYSMQIGVGTSSAAPVWTQYNLQAQTGSLVSIGTPSYVAGTNTIYFSASISMSSAATITEAAVFNAGFNAMLWRLTFNGVTIPQGGTATITFGYQV